MDTMLLAASVSRRMTARFGRSDAVLKLALCLCSMTPMLAQAKPLTVPSLAHPSAPDPSLTQPLVWMNDADFGPHVVEARDLLDLRTKGGITSAEFRKRATQIRDVVQRKLTALLSVSADDKSRVEDLNIDFLAHEFLYRKEHRRKIKRLLIERLGLAGANQIMQDFLMLQELKSSISPHSDHRTLESIAFRLEQAEEQKRHAQITAEQLNTVRHAVKSGIASWLGRQLGSSAADRALSRDWIFNGEAGDRVRAQLEERLGETATVGIIAKIDDLLPRLPRFPSDPLKNCLLHAMELNEKNRQGTLGDRQYMAAQKFIREHMYDWLHEQLGEEHASLAHSYVNAGEGEAAVIGLVTTSHGSKVAEQIQTIMHSLTLRNNDRFSFRFSRKNLVRGFVPSGHQAVSLPLALASASANNDTQELLDIIARETKSAQPPEVLSSFAPLLSTDKSLYLVFSDRMEPSKRGLAHFSGRKLRAIRVFQPDRRRKP